MYIPKPVFYLLVVVASLELIRYFFLFIRQMLLVLKKSNIADILAEKQTVAFREAYIKLYWERLGRTGKGGRPLKVAIWGGGLHTEWLYNLVQTNESIPGPEIVAIIDDSPNYKSVFWGRHVLPEDEVDFEEIEAIFISTDTIGKDLLERCRQYKELGIKILFPYEGMPSGQYPS